jgi:hypothetical protein
MKDAFSSGTLKRIALTQDQNGYTAVGIKYFFLNNGQKDWAQMRNDDLVIQILSEMMGTYPIRELENVDLLGTRDKIFEGTEKSYDGEENTIESVGDDENDNQSLNSRDEGFRKEDESEKEEEDKISELSFEHVEEEDEKEKDVITVKKEYLKVSSEGVNRQEGIREDDEEEKEIKISGNMGTDGLHGEEMGNKSFSSLILNQNSTPNMGTVGVVQSSIKVIY